MSLSSVLHWFHTAPGFARSPLVLLHGFTGAPPSWERVVATLSTPRAAAALALPGHHPAAPVAAGFDANVDWVADQLTRARLDGCHLVGYSLGARTALGLALRHPRIPARLTLIGVHPGLDAAAERARRVDSDRGWIELLRTRGMRAFVDAWERIPLFATQEQQAPVAARARQRNIRLGHDPEGLARSLEHMGLGVMPHYGAHLADLAMPVTLVAGARDSKFAALAHTAAAHMARARVELVPGCGHNLLLEAPAAVAGLVSSAPE